MARTTPPLPLSTVTHDNKLIKLPVPRQIWGYTFAKRTLDIAISATALVALTPLFSAGCGGDQAHFSWPSLLPLTACW